MTLKASDEHEPESHEEEPEKKQGSPAPFIDIENRGYCGSPFSVVEEGVITETHS